MIKRFLPFKLYIKARYSFWKTIVYIAVIAKVVTDLAVVTTALNCMQLLFRKP